VKETKKYRESYKKLKNFRRLLKRFCPDNTVLRPYPIEDGRSAEDIVKDRNDWVKDMFRFVSSQP